MAQSTIEELLDGQALGSIERGVCFDGIELGPGAATETTSQRIPQGQVHRRTFSHLDVNEAVGVAPGARERDAQDEHQFGVPDDVASPVGRHDQASTIRRDAVGFSGDRFHRQHVEGVVLEVARRGARDRVEQPECIVRRPSSARRMAPT